MTNILLSGAFGRMGRVIAALAAERDDCRIAAGFDVVGGESAFPVYNNFVDLTEKTDVVIDFSHPASLPGLLSYCKAKKLPLIAATTGYSQEEIDEIKSTAKELPIFFTGNMSLGINLLQDLAKRAARVLGTQFDIEIVERHHNLKKDAPSGTALMLADSVNSVFDNEKQYIYDRHGILKQRETHEIGIHAVRGGTIVGDHDVVFAGHDEVITLSHSAQSKEVFAVGAINAAIFMKDKPNGLYNMSDLLK